MARRDSSRSTARRNTLPLYTTPVGGIRVIKRIDIAKAEVLLRLGQLKRRLDGFGRLEGYDMLDEARVDDTLLPTENGNGTIAVYECLANAGLSGKSQTEDMSEEDRLSRMDPHGKQLPCEDMVELARAKVREHTRSANVVDGDRAVRAYPRAAKW